MDSKSKNLEIRGLNSDQVWDYENAYHWFSHPSRIGKMFAHYEIYKKIVDIPGHVVELGVYKAASMIRWLTLREILESQFSRKVIGFDSFGKFPVANLDLQDDLNFINKFEDAGGDGLTMKECDSILAHKRFENYFLVEGNIFDTLPAYISDSPELKIALLHLDMDVKEPTAYALEMLYDRVVPGGLIVIDDYNAVAGATQAVDEFIDKKRDEILAINKSSYYNVPAYITKL